MRGNGCMYKRFLKRKIDFLLSLMGLIVLSPVFLVIAVLIKIDDPGPVFFKQKRVGIHKSHFNLYKFRSMKISTPDVPTHLLKNPEQYISRVGSFLRKSSLDELPQMLNILLGQMSIIGPRPALWNQYDLIEERDKYGANDVLPGLTGWAQINGRDELEIQVKAKLDGEYVEKLSFWFDLKCFFGTIKAVIKKEGIVEGAAEENKKKNKILLVANVSKEHVLKFHVPTIKMFKDMGWTVDVACAGKEEVPYCNNQYEMSYKRSPFNFALLKGIGELRKIINNGTYDIVYCHTPVGGLAARIASVSARKKGTKVVYFAHGYHFYEGAPKINWLIYYSMEKVLSCLTDSIILINQEDYALTKNKFTSCKAYFLDGIGVDISRLKVEDKEVIRNKYRMEMNIPENATVLIYMAELLKNKNQTLLLRVLRELLERKEDVYLVLAGMDHCEGEFEKYAAEINVNDHVRFLGWRDDIGNLYAMADICTPTSIREGFGLNLVEAMACGLPVVASKNRGHASIIDNGRNGFLVELNQEKEFAERILELIHNKELKEKFIKVGLEEQIKYTGETILQEIRKIMNEHI